MSERSRFLHNFTLTPRDERHYNKIVKTIQRKYQTNAEYNAYYEKILTSDKYSYEVKQKAVLWMYALAPSRLWGLRNLSGEALFVFVTENMQEVVAKGLTVEDMQALVENPAFLESSGSDFDVVKKVFSTPYTMPVKSELQFRKTLIAGAVLSTNMTLDLADTILTMREPFHTADLMERWHLDEEPLVNWVRETYDMGDIPDLWVRQFLSEMAS